MLRGLLVAPTSFRKPHLNMLREATVAQAPRAHFDPRRSEGPFFFFLSRRLSESWKPSPARCLETRLLPVSHPAVAPGDSRQFSWAGARPGVFQDTSGEKQKISHGNQITPPLQTRSHTLCTLLPLKPKHQGVTWNLSMCLTDVVFFFV